MARQIVEKATQGRKQTGRIKASKSLYAVRVLMGSMRPQARELKNLNEFESNARKAEVVEVMFVQPNFMS